MTLIACFATPHPPVMVPEVGRERAAEVSGTVDAMHQLAREAKSLAPEVIVLMSPHAPLDMNMMGVSAASWFEGSFSMFGAPEVRMRLDGAPDLARAIVRESSARGVPAHLLHAGRGAELDHGSMTPLVMLVENLAPLPSLVVLSFSYLEPERHVEFGRAVGSMLQADPRRILYVASSDLSHRLIPGAPAGYSPRGAEFDAAVVAAFKSGDLSRLLTIPRDLVHDAGECGLRSLFTLSGVIEGLDSRTRLLSYEGPFGVGYLVGVVDVDAPTRANELVTGCEAATTPPGDSAGAADSDTARGVAQDAAAHTGRDADTHTGRDADTHTASAAVADQDSDDDAVVALARRAAEAVVRGGERVEPALPVEGLPPRAGVFVSLHLPDGSLRGCIGTFAPTKATLGEEIVASAVNAATRDPRFFPVREEELSDLRVSVDILDEPEDVESIDQLDPAEYGIIVRTDDGRQALLLPDLEGVETARDQLAITCRKGGIDPTKDRYHLQRFRVTRHGRH